MKTKKLLLLASVLAGLSASVRAAPEILSYSGRITVSGQPFAGQGHFKFALVNRTGQVSYWANEGNFTVAQEPTLPVAATVTDGVYTVPLGDTSLTNMQAIPSQVFSDHNDVHLRIWFSATANGPYDLLSPDQPVTSVPYALNGGGGGGSSGGGSTVQQTTVVEGGRVLTSGDLVRLVATGPANPSQTLILLEGDEVDVVTYSAGQPARLEYSFGEHTFAIPQTTDGLEILQTLMGPGAVRLTAATGHQTLAVLRVRRTGGRTQTILEGGETNATQSGQGATGPAVVSLPNTRTVVRGGATTLFVSASGKNLNYQWKKDGQSLTNTPAGTAPPAGSSRVAGASGPALTLSDTKAGDSGSYTVVITNPQGGTTSSTAVSLLVDTLMKNVPTGAYKLNATPNADGHEVFLSSYNVDMYEVKQSYWEEVYDWATKNGYDFDNPGMNTDTNGVPQTGDHPIHSVSWYDAVKWANARSEKDGFVPCYYSDANRTQVYRKGQVNVNNFMVKWTAGGYRLPTEAEWEIAARGGDVARRYSWGDSPFPSRANYLDTRVGKTAAVGSFPANGLGLHDMQGNLMEWVWDWKDHSTYDYDYKDVPAPRTWALHRTVTRDSHFVMGHGTWKPFGKKPEQLIRTFYQNMQYVNPATGSSTHHDGTSYWDSTAWAVKSRIHLPTPAKVLGVMNSLRSGSSYSSRHAFVKFQLFEANGSSRETNHHQYYGSWTPKSSYNPDRNTTISTIDMWLKQQATNSSYTAEARDLAYSVPAPGTMQLSSIDGNFTNAAVPAREVLLADSLNENSYSISNTGPYTKIKVIPLGTPTLVSRVTHGFRGYNNSYVATGRIQFSFSDGTESNSTEVSVQSSNLTDATHANPFPLKTVTKVTVWLKSYNPTEGNTRVWGPAVSESVVASYRGGDSWSSDSYGMVRTLALSAPAKVTRVRHQMFSNINPAYTNYSTLGNVKVEFKYADGTDANSTELGTAYRHDIMQERSHANPNPNKDVSEVRLWMSDKGWGLFYVRDIDVMGPATDASAQVKTNHLVDSSNYAKVKSITLATPMKIANVTNELRNETNGYTTYCKIEFTYSDGTDANSTVATDSGSTFDTVSNYANPSPEKTVTKVAVWLTGHNSGYNLEAYERNTRFRSIDLTPVTTPDTYEVESILRARTAYETVKVITLPAPEKLEGVMNEIKRDGNTGRAYCQIRYVYDDNTTSVSSAQDSAGNQYVTKTYSNPQKNKLVKRIEVQTHVNTASPNAFVYERRTSILRPLYDNSPVSYITFELPQYEENSTHFKVKIDATREADDEIWFALLDGNGTKTYAEADFEKYHPVVAPIGKPKKLRIYMRPKADAINPVTAVSAVYWTTNDPKSFYSGQDRIYRGEHFDETVLEVRSRRQIVPSNTAAKRGFRLVQRSN